MADPSRTASVGDGLDGLKRVGLPASAHQRQSEPERSLTTYVLFALHDRLVADLGTELLFPLLRRAPAALRVGDVRAFLGRARQHPEVAAWSEETTAAVAQQYCASVRDFGLARGTVRKVAVRPALYGSPVRLLIRALRMVGTPPLTLVQAPIFGLGAQLAISVNNCPPPRDPRSRMTSFKRTQRKYVQKAYRVRNWREYETGLRARGSLTVWLGLTDGKLANWNSPRPTRRKPGRQRQYSNHAIETTVTLGLVFGLASRQTEGFLRSRLTLLNLDNDVPDHSTISRRKARLGKVASYERRTVKPVHLRIDSSGLSVHVGQLRTPPKARDYRKLHLAVDEQTSDVVACALTSKRARDASRVASLVGQIERPIASAKADAAYDTGDVEKTLENHRAHRSPKVLIPPRKGAQLALDSAGTRQRNRNIRARSRVGKRKWYVASGDSRRSKVETTFHRYKAILGSAMRARGLASQRVEVRLGCKILNTMDGARDTRWRDDRMTGRRSHGRLSASMELCTKALARHNSPVRTACLPPVAAGRDGLR